MKFGLAIALVAGLAYGGPSDAARDALDKARQLGDLYNWADAAPFFIEAERLYTDQGNPRDALYSKLGRIRSTMEQVSLPETSAWLAQELDSNPLLQNDKELRLFCLIIKGDIDGELTAGPMRRDWEAVRDLAQELHNDRWVNRASAEIGFAHFLEGEISTARQLVGASLLKAMATKDVGAQIRYLAAIGTGLVLMGSSQDALPYFDKALAVADAHPEAGYQFLIHEGRLLVCKHLGRWKEAREIADEMLAQARAKQKRVKECQVLITSSGISTANKDYDRAQSELESAVVLARNGGFSRLFADTQSSLSELYRTRGDLQRAEELAEVAAEATQTSGELYLIPGRLELLAHLKVLRGKYAAADAIYSRAADFVEAMLPEVPNTTIKSSLIMAMSNLYAGHFALLAEQLHDLPRAYAVLERARGRVTFDILSNGVGPRQNPTETITREVSQLHLKLVSARTRAQVRQIRDQIFVAEQSRWIAEQRVGDAPVRTIPLSQVRRGLRPNELLLEYVLAEPRSYCLAISASQVQLVPLPGAAKIEGLVSDLLKSTKAKRPVQPILSELFKAVLAGVPGLQAHSRLIVVPDGRLHLLPFDALIDRGGQYVVSSHVVSYAASASSYHLVSGAVNRDTTAQGVLVVGGVPYSTSASAKVAMSQRLTKVALADLPGSEDEVEVPSSLLRGGHNTRLVGSNATEAAFKRANLSRQRLIHLSVHALADELHPDRAALVLLSDAAAGEDGILQGMEIMNLHLNADLVVLSACDTAAGRLLGEEGVGTVSRAFQLAGARSVLSTLWTVDDTFSLNLMKRFYSRLGSGQSIADALAGAKRDILREFGARAVPYYWAGFIVDGAAGRRLDFKQENGGRRARAIYAERTSGNSK